MEFLGKGYTVWVGPEEIVPEMPAELAGLLETPEVSLTDGKIEVPPGSEISTKHIFTGTISPETVQGINLTPGTYPVRVSLEAATSPTVASIEELAKYRIWRWKYFDTEVQIPE